VPLPELGFCRVERYKLGRNREEMVEIRLILIGIDTDGKKELIVTMDEYHIYLVNDII